MWNFGDILDIVADSVDPVATAFIHDGHVTSWPDAKRRMDALARGLVKLGAGAGDKLGCYMRNGPTYGEALGACFLASLTHANINYRYGAQEVAYILANADAAILVYDPEFRSIVAQIRPLLPLLRIFIETGDAPDRPTYAQSFEQLATAEPDGTVLPPRTPDNQLMIYTGGTTGMPKAVQFYQTELALYLLESSGVFGNALPTSLADIAALVRRQGVDGLRLLPACPQMHATGLFVTIWTILTGGCTVTISGRTFDPHRIWSAVARDRPVKLVIVGDPFARPLLAALDASPGTYDLNALQAIASSGAMWSADIKERLLEHVPHVQLIDVISSTEAMGVGASVTTRDSKVATAGFTLGPNAIVIDEHNRKLPPGTGIVGRLAVGGTQPRGYYKDPDKTKATFVTIDGVRYSIPGDYAVLEDDGTIRLLGRGSSCINTGGEKVFPEEVEEVLKLHPSVEDALVIGLQDRDWGQAVTGVITLAPDADFDQGVLRAHVKSQLADYKVPKRIVVADVALRGPSGKADYKAAAACAARLLVG